MSYSDLNIHLCVGESLSKLLQDDFSLECPFLLDRIQKYLETSASDLKSTNFMLFNQSLSVIDIEAASSVCSQYPNKNIFLSLLASPDYITSFECLSSLKSAGLNAISFHSYHQSITKAKYSDFEKLAVWAEDLNMPILVDGSYGTIDIYNINNLEFVAYLASLVKSTPIVVMHSGGARVLEAMLLAESTSNIFLETSFTLPYYAGSSVEGDLAFAYKKIGPERVLYASDHPYISHEASLAATLKFFDKYNFNPGERDWILKDTFYRLFVS